MHPRTYLRTKSVPSYDITMFRCRSTESLATKYIAVEVLFRGVDRVTIGPEQ